MKPATVIRLNLSDDNALIAEQLIELTEENSDWGFGLCFSYLRHVENHYLESQAGLPYLLCVALNYVLNQEED